MSDGVLEAPSTAWLVPFLLLDLRKNDAYGHELTRRMADAEFHATRPRTLYRALRHMEGEGMILCERDRDGGSPSQRRYSIADAGEAYLEFWAESLVRYREEMDLFFEAYTRDRVTGV